MIIQDRLAGFHNNGSDGIVIVRVKVPTESYPFRSETTAPKTAHAARIEDGIVRQVIVIPHLDDDDAKITAYCNRIGLAGTWVDTSYTGSRRGKYAGVGDTFAMTKNGGEFVSPVVEEIEAMSIAVKTADGWQVLGVGGDGDCDLVGGVAGWAAIESVSGTADLATLKAAYRSCYCYGGHGVSLALTTLLKVVLCIG